MSHDDAIAALIPWYVNGTLDPSEREPLERHLRACPSCQRLLQQARANVELTSLAKAADQLEHVQPLLLVQYAEDSSQLEPETVRWIEDRLQVCRACRDSLERLRELAEPADEPASVSRSVARENPIRAAAARVWPALAGSVLHPIPAMAYLLLLLALLPVARRALDSPATSGDLEAISPSVLVARGQSTTRAEAPPVAEPLEIDRPRTAGEPLVLLLVTELEPDELSALNADGFAVAMSRQQARTWELEKTADQFITIEGKSALLVVMATPELQEAADFELAIRVSKPGSPLDKQAIYRRAFVFR